MNYTEFDMAGWQPTAAAKCSCGGKLVKTEHTLCHPDYSGCNDWRDTPKPDAAAPVRGQKIVVCDTCGHLFSQRGLRQ